MKRVLSHLNEHIDDFFLLSRNRAFPELDGIRAWAIITVMMAHICAWLYNLLSEVHVTNGVMELVINIAKYTPFIGGVGGGLGVDLFFMLSGFLIFVSIHKSSPSFTSFIRNRYRRLLPVHLILLTSMMEKVSLIAAIVNVFFLADFLPSYPNLYPITWTLNYEILFYLLAALWFITAKQIRLLQTWKCFFLFSILLFVTQWIVAEPLMMIGIKYPDMNRFTAFFFGVALAKLYLNEKLLWTKLEKFFLYATILALPMILLVRYTYDAVTVQNAYGILWESMSYVLLDLGYFLILGSMLISKDHLLKKLFRARLVRVIGVISYSMYLFHYGFGLPIAKGVLQSVSNYTLKIALYTPVSFAITILFSIILFHYLEKPYFLNKRNKK